LVRAAWARSIARFQREAKATGIKHQLVRGQRGSPHHPTWSPDGKTLFYNPAPGVFESVSVTTRPAFSFGNPVAAPRMFLGGPPGVQRLSDMMPNGRFLALVQPGQTNPDNVTDEFYVVLNWLEELRATVLR
jgi:hypothetical protein